MANERGQSFVVLNGTGETDAIIFGRNSLKLEDNEVPEVVLLPAGAGEAIVKCSSVEVEGKATFAVILSRTVGQASWGAESGANEKGVCIGVSWAGNESTEALLATDLARLGLERSSTASEAIDVIAALNEKYGSSVEAPNSNKLSLIICDTSEVWIMDIVGKLWAAEHVKDGFRKFPSNLAVQTQIDKSSSDLQQRAQDLGLWDGTGSFNFQATFSPGDAINEWPGEKGDDFTLENMFALLREKCPDQESVKSSQVSVLCRSGLSSHWFTATPNIRESVYKPFVFTPNVKVSPLTIWDEQSGPETLLAKYHGSRDWDRVGGLLQSLEATCVTEMKEMLTASTDLSELDELMKDCVEAEVKFYR